MYQTQDRQVVSGLEKLQELKARLNTFYIDREDVVDTSIISLMTRNHHLQVGPPGTAKSALVRSISEGMNGVSYVEKLAHRTMEVDDLFGALDLDAVRAGNNRRNTDGSVVTADILFMDELYRMSEILAAPLLSVTNERLYSNGKEVETCSLISMFAGTNDYMKGRR